MDEERHLSITDQLAGISPIMPETGADPREFAARNAAGPIVSFLTESQIAGSAGGSSGVPLNVVTKPGARLTLAFAATGDITWDVTPDTALTLTLAGGTTGVLQRLTLILRQPASGGFTVTLPPAKYQGGVTPVVSTIAGQTTVITFMTDDAGTTIYGGV
ncbi:hypothetical protein GOB93_04610 [Acetobacter musti]|uniref:Uncharacterized protein n=1 Tax=Acetobacter musti TaxID=864732 RepID=A0ABX0JKP5_9PROT|nr:hypothetical protein [Acetobacter musti]NHN83924.1 hypothetical protein [Acetobacter musti]